MKLAMKLGILFFAVVLLLQLSGSIILYNALLKSRIDEETHRLVARGKNYSELLMKNKQNKETFINMASLEERSPTKLVVTGPSKQVIVKSDEIDPDMQKIINKKVKMNHKGVLLESDWKEDGYITSITFGKYKGEPNVIVYLFLDTLFIQDMNDHLMKEFIKVSLITAGISIVAIIFFTRTITRPLISMKKTTKMLSHGQHEVSLDINRKDELGELAQEITKLSRAMLKLQRERNDFLANISHELRTPLTYIKGYTNIVKRPTLSEEQRNEYLSIINDEANHLTKLIEDLFELMAMNETKFLITKKEVIVTDVVRKVIENIKPAFLAKRIHLVFTCDDDYLMLLDENRISQVLLIMLDNALKHSKEETHVIVTVGAEGNHVVLRVIDQGEGIAEEELPYIWERLYRAEKSRTRNKVGFGLGLTIAKEILELHGAEISVQSKEGEGTTFIIRLGEEIKR
ncbi:integral membrane sensor signal transduction histidine kinase [Fictibacillus macauensis ZFHKF-1]|uniref:histidine kinase n=1 Tax=Fictibacillus macauensis ZFHKF-1 TaxID=1196324 RepID=I8IXU2_9BACL|nr:HAMP domain-containing sensor histidine kinase [Fictibacillus macauensis]EIT84306.1 integral membrane sensor signal transduction histidine kinase [Fictibacillus macauensis ZFHKF-1]